MKDDPKKTSFSDRLHETFFDPPDSITVKNLRYYTDQILFDLNNFLSENVGTATDVCLGALSENYQESLIPGKPGKKFPEMMRSIVEEIAPHGVNVSSPYFMGHMTAAIPWFMVHLSTVLAALNQNVVKLETSGILSVIERQVLAKIHRLIFSRSDEFYRQNMQHPDSTLGSFVEDGSLANLTALWVARNQAFRAMPGFEGIAHEGIGAAFEAYGIRRCAVLISRLGHYSIQKAGGVLGIGNDNILKIDVDQNCRMDMRQLRKVIASLHRDRQTKILALVGIAGTTETGTLDPLVEMAELCAEHQIYFHVDAAWGGPTLMSEQYRSLLSGIELADSVTIDGHKQFYMPMTCGMVYFREPNLMDEVAYHSAYVNRQESADLGRRSLCGSRAAVSLILHCALEMMGSRGYAAIIDHCIDTAKSFAREIRKRPLFQLVTSPELNIFTYRVFPDDLRRKWDSADFGKKQDLNQILNHINTGIQRTQRQFGKGFVSRTTLDISEFRQVVLRVVIMNPMTDMKIVREILDEQEKIYSEEFEN